MPSSQPVATQTAARENTGLERARAPPTDTSAKVSCAWEAARWEGDGWAACVSEGKRGKWVTITIIHTHTVVIVRVCAAGGGGRKRVAARQPAVDCATSRVHNLLPTRGRSRVPPKSCDHDLVLRRVITACSNAICGPKQHRTGTCSGTTNGYQCKGERAWGSWAVGGQRVCQRGRGVTMTLCARRRRGGGAD